MHPQIDYPTTHGSVTRAEKGRMVGSPWFLYSPRPAERSHKGVAQGECGYSSALIGVGSQGCKGGVMQMRGLLRLVRRGLREVLVGSSRHRLDAWTQRWFSLVRMCAWIVAPLRWAQYALHGFKGERLHVGCGTVHLEGWINADLDPRAELVVDIRRRLPFRSDRFERIYSEHVVEHLYPEDGASFMREAYRTLKPGGVIRTAMPDLDSIVAGYEEGWEEFDWIGWPGFEFIETRAEMINISFRWWGHKWLYNAEELERGLRSAGFSQIRLCNWGESEHADLRGLETRLVL